ncbi:hypothetical protein, partial [Ralstonia solanacearum]|uniref:hypothetical protein n=1 Tax=Ralstonia solanacearum TaxID=305 RepID=UPI0035EF10FC
INTAQRLSRQIGHVPEMTGHVRRNPQERGGNLVAERAIIAQEGVGQAEATLLGNLIEIARLQLADQLAQGSFG